MARDTAVLNRTDDTTDELPNLVTVVGRGGPSSFEITVDGAIEMVHENPIAEGTVVSGGTVEGTIDVGIQQFRFSGDMANVRVGEDDTWTPKPRVHVEYNANEL